MIKNIIAVILLYLFINNPFFTIFKGYSSLYILLPLLIFLKNDYTRLFIKIHKDIIISYFLIILFGVLRTVLGGDIYYLERLLIQFTSSLLLSSVIICLFYKYKISFLKTSVWMIIVAVSISILCFVIPSFNNYVKFELQHINEALIEKEYRCFGLSDALTSAYGYVLATFFGYGLYKGYGNKKWFWFLSPFLAISILINARTAILVLISSIILYYIFHFKKGSVKQILYIFIGLMIIFRIIGTSNQTSNWITEFYLEIKDIVNNTQEAEHDTYGALVDDIILPENQTQWFIGRGHSLFIRGALIRSDVGFINQLAYGGLVYIFIILATFIILIKKIKNYYFMFFCIVMMLIGNIKGNYLETSDGYRFLTFLIMAEYFEEKVKLYKK